MRASNWSRTSDLLIFSQALYQLSYKGAGPARLELATAGFGDQCSSQIELRT